MTYIDIGVATWVSCLAGKKTFWAQNQPVDDQEVWSDFDVDDDHRLFSEPWLRIDLYPGSVLEVLTGATPAAAQKPAELPHPW